MSDLDQRADADWMSAWQPLIDAIGQDFGGETIIGADAVDPSAIRRYLEPLEFDCPLHYDAQVARAAGFADITAPYTSVLTFALPAMWSPGERLFDSDARNAAPVKSAISMPVLPPAPPASEYFATNLDMEFIRAVVVGDRLSKRGMKLLACTPRETRVGRGAFITLESEIVDQYGDRVAVVRMTHYRYNPRERSTS